MKKLIIGILVSTFCVSGAFAYNFNQLPPNKMMMVRATNTVTATSDVFSARIISGEANLIRVKNLIGTVRLLATNSSSESRYITLSSGEVYEVPQYVSIAKNGYLYFRDTRIDTTEALPQVEVIYWYRSN